VCAAQEHDGAMSAQLHVTRTPRTLLCTRGPQRFSVCYLHGTVRRSAAEGPTPADVSPCRRSRHSLPNRARRVDRAPGAGKGVAVQWSPARSKPCTSSARPAAARAEGCALRNPRPCATVGDSPVANPHAPGPCITCRIVQARDFNSCGCSKLQQWSL